MIWILVAVIIILTLLYRHNHKLTKANTDKLLKIWVNERDGTFVVFFRNMTAQIYFYQKPMIQYAIIINLGILKLYNQTDGEIKFKSYFENDILFLRSNRYDFDLVPISSSDSLLFSEPEKYTKLIKIIQNIANSINKKAKQIAEKLTIDKEDKIELHISIIGYLIADYLLANRINDITNIFRGLLLQYFIIKCETSMSWVSSISLLYMGAFTETKDIYGSIAERFKENFENNIFLGTKSLKVEFTSLSKVLVKDLAEIV